MKPAQKKDVVAKSADLRNVRVLHQSRFLYTLAAMEGDFAPTGELEKVVYED